MVKVCTGRDANIEKYFYIPLVEVFVLISLSFISLEETDRERQGVREGQGQGDIETGRERGTGTKREA